MPTFQFEAIDAATGKEAWHFIAGSRIDSPPTWHAGRVIFGCMDGSVYALRASDGELCWRFRAAPTDLAAVVRGESGTGKELVARALHRARRPVDVAIVRVRAERDEAQRPEGARGQEPGIPLEQVFE